MSGQQIKRADVSLDSVLEDVFPGDSAMSALMRSHGWASTPLGSPQTWPEGLKVPLRMMLTSRFEMWLGWGPDLRFFYNDAYIPTLGVKHPNGALGQPFHEVWREVYADVADQVAAVRQGNSTWNEALLLLLERNGFPEETYHTFSYSPLRGDDGQIEGMMCVVSEETERVISERRLATLRGLATALVAARSRTEIIEATMGVLAGNTCDFPFASLYMFDEDGAAHLQGAAPEGLAHVTWPFAALLDGHADEGLEFELGASDAPRGAWTIPPSKAFLIPIHQPGRDRPLGALALGLNPYRPGDPEMPGFVQLIVGQLAGALANVEAFDAERRRADQVWRNSRDLMVVVSADGVFRSVNPACATILGYAADEMEGQHLSRFIHPEDIASSENALEEAGDHNLNNFENRFVDRDGVPHWISWHTAVEGELVYGYGRDVTDQRRAEEALRQSQKMEAVGQLTGGIAHDFNNLLTIISSSAGLLRRSELSEERRGRYVDAIAETTDRAAKLTGQLLAFARRQPLAPEVFDVGAQVESVAEMLRPVVGGGVRITFIHPSEISCAEADRAQFDTALVNLAINARDAMDGEGELTIEVARAAEAMGIAGDYVAVRVSDSGQGISEAHLAHIFEPFFTTKEVGKGTGLGLSQVFGFTKQSGGEIEARNREEGGASFVLYLPRSKSRILPVVEDDPPPAPPSDRQLTVLLVEDNETVATFSAQLLRDLGYEPTRAATAEEALLILQAGYERFDVVFSDVVMPGMGGVALGETVRERYPGLPVVLTSGYSDVLAEQGRTSFELLQKPYSVDALALVLRRAVGA